MGTPTSEFGPKKPYNLARFSPKTAKTVFQVFRCSVKLDLERLVLSDYGGKSFQTFSAKNRLSINMSYRRIQILSISRYWDKFAYVES